MAIAYNNMDVKQIFNWSDTIDIDNMFRIVLDKMKHYNPLFRLLSGDTDVSMTYFRRISKLSDEEIVTLKLMNFNDEEIKNICTNAIEFDNVRSLPLGIVKNTPSPIISYNRTNYILTSVFLYSDLDDDNPESEKINDARRCASVFNLVESMLTTYLLSEYKIPVDRATSTIYMGNTFTISDSKFILKYYYTLFSIIINYISRETILSIINSRIINPDTEDYILPGYDSIEKILDLAYDNDISTNNQIDMMQRIYNECNIIVNEMDNLEAEALSDFGGEDE